MIQDIFYNSQNKHHDSVVVSNATCVELNGYQDTVDGWRHRRMYSYLDPILSTSKKADWLTVGDGSYGQEANFLSQNGGTALATDLSVERLRHAKKIGYIKNYKKENAEKLSFSDNVFDYVLCKESYHHFPRPIIALYEMIRVAKKAVILIEPNDVIKRGFSLKQLVGIEEVERKVNRFEVSGNYVYTISRREIEKIALGMGLPTIAFAGIDDHYIKGVEQEDLSTKGRYYRKISLVLWILNLAYILGIRDRSLLVSIIFKTKPSAKLRKALLAQGYQIFDLPNNPYLK